MAENLENEDLEVLKIVVAVHGRWHGFDLAEGLYQRGHLARLLTTYPASVVTKFLPAGVPLMTAPWLEMRRRFYDKFHIGGKPDLGIAKSFGGFVSRHGIGNVDVLVGWSSATLEAMPLARTANMKVVIERGSSHIVHQTEVLTEAFAEFGLEFLATHPEIIVREEQEYNLADAIVVPTQFAAHTFAKRGLGEKVIVNPYGVDLTRFFPLEKANSSRKPRIIFVGGVGIRKGVPWLLRAFKGLAAHAELHLVGPIEKGFDQILKGESLDGVYLRGAVPSDALIDELQAADIFCLPSLEEGFPLSQLQAMASGLPVITTQETGAADIMTNDVEGVIVPAKSIELLRQALHRLVTENTLRQQMGQNARIRVEQGYSWDDYCDRAVQAYRELIAA